MSFPWDRVVGITGVHPSQQIKTDGNGQVVHRFRKVIMRAELIYGLGLCLGVVAAPLTSNAGEPVGTGFSYRGSLSAGGLPANGTYDLKFTLFDTLANGVPVALPLTNQAIHLSGGLFNVGLDFGAGAFDGNKRWLEIGVRTNGADADFETLIPRQELAPHAYALYAADAARAAVAQKVAPAVLSNPWLLTNTANSFSGSFTGNGSGLTGINAAALGGLGSSSFWQTGGNAATSAGLNFLGTTDAQPLEFKVNNMRGIRLEPTAAGAPNFIAGAAINEASVDAIGASIGGGGDPTAGEGNFVGAQFSTIGGGAGNRSEATSDFATIGGGRLNKIGTSSPEFFYFAFPTNSAIGGGYSNLIWVANSVIGGGSQNQIGGPHSFSYEAGQTISGGTRNRIGYQHHHSTIGGGTNNFIDAGTSTIAGGAMNAIPWAGGSYGHSIGGGIGNVIYSGYDGCTLSGGRYNFADGMDTTVSGGSSNGVDGAAAVVAGGSYNEADGDFSVVSGGRSNLVTGSLGAIPGGANNFATGLAFAAGYRARATNQGAFVWASGNTQDFSSTTDNSFHAYTPGGFEVDWGGQGADGQGLKWIALAAQTPGRIINVYNGAYLSSGGNWVDVSDRNAKKDFEPIDSREVLDRVAKLPLSTWTYRSDTEPARHMGPVAQDFHSVFGLGADERHISASDSSGVALAAIQGLNQKLEDEVKARDREIQQLKQTVDELKQLLRSMAETSAGGGR